MADPQPWRSMGGAPKDGSRILVTVRSAEQAPAEVDVAYWSRPDSAGAAGWRSADSHPGCVIAYADPELVCWMPMPSASPRRDIADMPAPFEGDEIEGNGSGI